MKSMVIILVSIIIGVISGGIVVARVLAAPMYRECEATEKYLEMFLFMSKWMKAKQGGGKISQFINRKEYKSVAIYGMSNMGELLLNELKHDRIDVLYAIDRNVNISSADGLKVYTLEEKLPEVDVVIVTPIHYFESIAFDLQKRTKASVISIEEVVDWILLNNN